MVSRVAVGARRARLVLEFKQRRKMPTVRRTTERESRRTIERYNPLGTETPMRVIAAFSRTTTGGCFCKTAPPTASACPSSARSCAENDTDVFCCRFSGRPGRFVLRKETIIRLPSTGICILILQLRIFVNNMLFLHEVSVKPEKLSACLGKNTG